MTDGVLNVALLDFKNETLPGFAPGQRFHGVIHFGMLEEAGGTYLAGRKEKDPNVHYEVKYRTPEGIVFDITESGWTGAVKDVVPSCEIGVVTGKLF